MKKIVLILFIFSSATLLATANTQMRSNDEDSYECRLYAYNQANASGYEYGSEDWQWVYYSEKRMCEMEVK